MQMLHLADIASTLSVEVNQARPDSSIMLSCAAPQFFEPLDSLRGGLDESIINMVSTNKARKYLLSLGVMYFRTAIAFLVLVAAVPTLSFTVHDPTSDKLEGRQQVSLSEGISANDQLAELDSPLLVLAITTEDLRNDNKAVQNAEKKGNLFGCPIKGKWTLFYAEYDPQIYITSQAG